MASPAVHLSLPAASLFAIPPRSDPLTIPAPSVGLAFSPTPFAIPAKLYTTALDVRVPITIASVYAVSVLATNAYNKANGNKPWAISKTKVFFVLVVIHNIFLAIYSAWTFAGMTRALYSTVASWNGPDGLVGTVDSLCKMHGKPGAGNFASYNNKLRGWVDYSPSKSMLNAGGLPRATDLGRLWNEGLAFYGWLFYISKFYEVVDTMIILAKGKKSSTLQTFHHAGAMICMWAGMRFMSPPIWIFCVFNSLIHSIMYTYYTITAFSIRVPQIIKRTLTTMQILQFQIGMSLAAFYSFVSYTIPVKVPVVSSATSSAIASSIIPTGSSLINLAKQYFFGATTPENVAANIIEVQEYTTEWKTVPCIDTSGQTFAIWLNVLYLVPLMGLFMRFFIKSYLRRPVMPGKGKVEKAMEDAGKGLGRMLNHENGHVQVQSMSM